MEIRTSDPLVWDVTCPDTFATSYELQATSEAGAVAALAKQKKMTKYKIRARTHLFCPIAIETSGVFGPDASAILRDWLAESKMYPVSQTQGHTCNKKFLLWRREAMQHLSWGVLVSLDLDMY